MGSKLVRIILLTGFITASGVFTGCATKDSDGAKKFIENYWSAVFKGAARKAYSMLTRKSKKVISFEKYALDISYGTERTALKDSFFAAYAPACNVSIGSVTIKDDTAKVEVLLTIPDLPNLNRTRLLAKADSLFAGKDTLARNEWLLRERTRAVREKFYRPLIMHLTLRLAWEWGSWRLIYE
jgi:hypothetical protein